MGKDERLTAGVAILGGGDLAELRRRSLVSDSAGIHAFTPLTADQASGCARSIPFILPTGTARAKP